MKHPLQSFACSLSILLLIGSCVTQDICDDDSQSYLIALFKTLDADDEVTDTTLADLSIFGIREGKTDSLLYDSVSVSEVELPLDPNRDFSHFVLSNGISLDTLKLTYSSEVYLISSTCGFAVRFALDEPSPDGSWINRIDMESGEIDAEYETDETHLWIFF